MRIEVCGGIASGKTTLASLLQPETDGVLLETFEENPFWQAFYSNPGRFIFETEVSFLLQHYHQIKAEAPERGTFVCDYSFVLDQAYADVGLNGSKHDVFSAVHREIRDEIGLPGLLVCLECDAEEELRRIRNRGRSVEDSIDVDFLTSLNDAVYDRFQELRGEIPTLLIDSTERDFAHDDTEKNRVVKEVESKIASITSEE
jgi:deoxyadenosine/deoxycytidine kinase